jgi:hypothetical protein
VDRLIVSGTHEATCGLAMQRPRPPRFPFPKSRKPREPENAKARKRESPRSKLLLSDELPVPFDGHPVWGVVRSLGCARIHVAPPENPHAQKQETVFLRTTERPSRANGIPRNRETRKPGDRQGRVAIASSSTRRRQSCEASFRTPPDRSSPIHRMPGSLNWVAVPWFGAT